MAENVQMEQMELHVRAEAWREPQGPLGGSRTRAGGALQEGTWGSWQRRKRPPEPETVSRVVPHRREAAEWPSRSTALGIVSVASGGQGHSCLVLLAPVGLCGQEPVWAPSRQLASPRPASDLGQSLLWAVGKSKGVRGCLLPHRSGVLLCCMWSKLASPPCRQERGVCAYAQRRTRAWR